MSAVQRVPIGALHTGLQNCLVVGVIIAKQESTHIRSKVDGTEKNVAHITLRDSPEDTVNVTLWLSDEPAKEFDEVFNIGDVVEVCNAKVQPASSAESDRYSPQVTSPVALVYSEPISRLSKHNVSAQSDHLARKFSDLMRIPTKNLDIFATLEDVQNNPRMNNGDFVNILAAVRSIGPVRTFTSKINLDRERGVREIRLIDQTSGSLSLKLWDINLIRLADSLNPLSDVLFLADVRIDWDNFRNCRTLTATSRSVVTVNPVSEHSELLRDYAKLISESGGIVPGECESVVLDYKTITRITNIVSIEDELQTGKSQSTGIIFGFFVRFDLDDVLDHVIAKRCVECKYLLRSRNGCLNEECDRFGMNDFTTKLNFRVEISDFTGTMRNCSIRGDTLDRLIGNVDQIESMSAQERTRMKWEHFLTPLKMWLVIHMPSSRRPNGWIEILNWQKVSYDELGANSPMPPIC